ncbi:MAG: hypothetical protein V4710_20615, partial [Verrucomicrobiota bacterium]
APLSAYQQHGELIKLTAEEAVMCEEEGGCFVVTQKKVMEAMLELGADAFKAGQAEGKASCANRT